MPEEPVGKKIDLKLASILLAGIAAYLYVFLPYPPGYVHVDPDSAYILSSLSSVIKYPLFYVDHPGVTLHILGRIPIFIGAFFVPGDDFIEKVLLNFPFYQYLFLWLIWALCVSAFVVYVTTFYKKGDGVPSLIAVLLSFTAIIPPTLCDGIGVNADCGAFFFGILFATSLMWERSCKTDLASSLFYALMVYCKVICVFRTKTVSVSEQSGQRLGPKRSASRSKAVSVSDQNGQPLVGLKFKVEAAKEPLERRWVTRLHRIYPKKGGILNVKPEVTYAPNQGSLTSTA